MGEYEARKELRNLTAACERLCHGKGEKEAELLSLEKGSVSLVDETRRARPNATNSLGDTALHWYAGIYPWDTPLACAALLLEAVEYESL